MRLTYIFIFFLTGLIISEPRSIGVSCLISLSGVVFGIIALTFALIDEKSRLLIVCLVSFFLGSVWMSVLPTWSEFNVPESVRELKNVYVKGEATGESFETAGGRYIPVRMTGCWTERIDETGLSCREEFQMPQRIILVKVSGNFMGVTGAKYRFHGEFNSDRRSIYAPIMSRYKAGGVFKSTNEIEMIGHPSGWNAFFNRLKYRLTSHLSWGLSESDGQLLAGIVLGRKGRRLGGDWTGDFYNAGLSHLIVASGAQVSILFFPLFLVMSRVRIGQNIKWVLLIFLGICLWGFCRILGNEPSIVRASSMGMVLLFAIGLNRQNTGFAALSAAGMYWLILNPLLARDTGFLLSMGACFGIIYVTPVLTRFFPAPRKKRIGMEAGILELIKSNTIFRFRQVLHFLIMVSLVTFGAQCGVMPILASTIGRISISGFISNLFAVPIGQLILMSGVVSGAGGFVSPRISVAINDVTSILTETLMKIANDFSEIPYGNTPITPIPGIGVLISYAIMVIWVERIKRCVAGKKPARKVLEINPDPDFEVIDNL